MKENMKNTGTSCQNKKLVLFTFFGVIIVGIAVFLQWSGNYFYQFALARNRKNFLEHNQDLPTDLNKTDIDLETWFSNVKKEELNILSRDHFLLSGCMLKQTAFTENWVICVHGYTNRYEAMTDHARFFHNKGWNVLLIDLRGHGRSEGDYIGMGYPDRLDLLDWIEKIIDFQPESKIALLGVSMGAATVMLAAGEGLPDQVKCVIEDCGYTNAYEEMKYQFHKLFPKLPAFVFLPITNKICKKRAGYSLNDADTLSAVKRNDTPILFIHGTEDKFVPFSMAQQLYQSAKCEKRFLAIDGAGHAECKNSGEKYWSTIEEFIECFF